MNNAAPNEEMIEIPDEAVVACPLVGFALTPVSRCVDCKAFAGLDDRFPGAGIDFAKRYAVKCVAEPVRRSLAMLAAKA